jgi:hypothetical protein
MYTQGHDDSCKIFGRENCAARSKERLLASVSKPERLPPRGFCGTKTSIYKNGSRIRLTDFQSPNEILYSACPNDEQLDLIPHAKPGLIPTPTVENFNHGTHELARLASFGRRSRLVGVGQLSRG